MDNDSWSPVNDSGGGNQSLGRGFGADDALHVTSKVGEYGRLIIPPIGIVGNLIAIIVFLRGRRASSVHVYLTTLAIMDITVLMTGMITHLERLHTVPDVITKYVAVCATAAWIFNASQTVSAWTLCGFSVDRLLAIRFPLQSHIICTKLRALVYVIVISIIFFLYNVHNFWTMGSKPLRGQHTCTLEEEHADFLVIMEWIRLFVYCFFPCVIIWICNVWIIITLRQSQKFSVRKSLRVSTTGATRLLIGVSTLFLITSLPYAILTVYKRGVGRRERILISYTVPLLMYLNHASNFYVYVLSGQKFRKELKSLFCCKASPSARAVGTNSTSSSKSAKNISRQISMQDDLPVSRQTSKAADDDEDKSCDTIIEEMESHI